MKRQLGVSRLMSCGQMLKDGHAFFDSDVMGFVLGMPVENEDEGFVLPFLTFGP
jgi:hypothetical protein